MITDLTIHLFYEDYSFREATVLKTNPEDALMLANLLTCGIYKGENPVIVLTYKNGSPFSAVSLGFDLDAVKAYILFTQAESFTLIMGSSAHSFSPEWGEANLRFAVKCRRTLRKIAQMRDAVVVAYDGEKFCEEATRFAETGFKVCRIFEEHIFQARQCCCMVVGMHLSIIKKQRFGREAEEIQQLIDSLKELENQFMVCPHNLKAFYMLKEKFNILTPYIDKYMEQFEDDEY